MWTRTQSSCDKSMVNALPKVVGFLRVLRFLPQGKLTNQPSSSFDPVFSQDLKSDLAMLLDLLY